MPNWKKARLQEIKADPSAAPIDGTEIEVQFNPASLKLELANRVEGGDTRGRQDRQYLGKTSTTLSFDLYFDTADRGTTDAPVSVRTLTAAVERFVLPKGAGNTKQAPPKARFHWDELVIDGIIESVSIDFELFAPNGTPLRAKLGVSIKEQDAKYQLLQLGPGANRVGGGAHDSSAIALAGESAADFTARMGLDPAGWRGIAAQLGGGSALSLRAGASIGFDSSLSAGGGIGISLGVEAGARVSLGASFGLEAGASLGLGGAVTGAAAGFAVSAAGGISAAIETVAVVQAGSAAEQTRRSFGSAVPPSGPSSPRVTAPAGVTAIGSASIPLTSASAGLGVGADVPPPSSTPKPSMPDQSRTPLRLGSAAPPPGPGASAGAPPPPTADPRATAFGFGVPLKPRLGSAADLRASAAAGRTPLRPRARVTDILSSNDPSRPPWTQLPTNRVRRVADHAQAVRFPLRPCGCGSSSQPGGYSCQ